MGERRATPSPRGRPPPPSMECGHGRGAAGRSSGFPDPCSSGGGHGREPRRPLALRLLAEGLPAERGPGTGAAAASGGELSGAGGMLGSNGRRRAPRHVAASRTAATALALARGNPARNDAVRLIECRCSKKIAICARYILYRVFYRHHCGEPERGDAVGRPAGAGRERRRRRRSETNAGGRGRAQARSSRGVGPVGSCGAYARNRRL